MASPPSSPPNNPSPSKPKPPSPCPNPKPPFSHPTKHRSPSPRSKPRNLRTSPHAASSSPISSNHPIPSNPKPQPSTTPRHPSSTSTPLSSPNSHTPPPPATLANLQPAYRPLPNSNSPYRVAARGRVLINLPTGAEAWPPLPAPQSKLDLISGSNPQSGSSTAKWLEKTMKKDGKKIIAEVRSSLGKSKTTGKAKRKMDESASEASLDPPLTKQEERELRGEYVLGLGPLQVECMCNLIFIPNCTPIHEDMAKVAEVVTEEDWLIANELGTFTRCFSSSLFYPECGFLWDSSMWLYYICCFWIMGCCDTILLRN